MNKGCAGCIFLIYFVACMLFAASFSTLEPTEAGIRRSTFGTLDKSRVYISGRYFLDITHKFIRYPLTLQTIKFAYTEDADRPPLKASVAGGQEVRVHCSFQYRLMLNQLIQLYMDFETNYETQYISIAEETIKNKIKQYASEQIYQNRTTMGKVIHVELNEKMQERFAVVEHFQILTVEPPVKTSEKILQKIITQEQIQTQTFKKNSSVITTNISVIEQGAAQKSREFVSRAVREASVLTSEGEAEAIVIRLNATVEAYDSLKTGLNLTNDELVQFLFLEHLRNAGSSTQMAIGVDTALVSL